MHLPQTDLWRQRPFLLYWIGQTISVFGSQISLLTLPLTAVLTLNATSLQMGLLRAAQTAPFLVVGLFAGVWADQRQRRPILIVTDAGRALLLATIPIAAGLDRLSMVHVFAVALGMGVFTTLATVAQPSFVPSVVGRQHLLEGNSRLFMSSQAAGVAGPGIAGGLVQLVTAPVAILADAFSFGVSALLLAINRVPEPSRATQKVYVLREIGEGLRFVWDDAVIRAVALATGLLNLFGGMLGAVFILYATQTLHIEPGSLGVALAVAGCAGLLGATTAGATVRRLGLGTTLILATTLSGASTSLLPIAELAPLPPILLLAVQQSLLALTSVVYSINAVSLLQALTPERVLGRMTATTRVISNGGVPLGALLGGALGGTVGLQPVLWIVAAGVFLAVPFLWFSPVRTLTRMPSPTESGAVDAVIP